MEGFFYLFFLTFQIILLLKIHKPALILSYVVQSVLVMTWTVILSPSHTPINISLIQFYFNFILWERNLRVRHGIILQMASVRQILLPASIESPLPSTIIIGLPCLQEKKHYSIAQDDCWCVRGEEAELYVLDLMFHRAESKKKTLLGRIVCCHVLEMALFLKAECRKEQCAFKIIIL